MNSQERSPGFWAAARMFRAFSLISLGGMGCPGVQCRTQSLPRSPGASLGSEGSTELTMPQLLVGKFGARRWRSREGACRVAQLHPPAPGVTPEQTGLSPQMNQQYGHSGRPEGRTAGGTCLAHSTTNPPSGPLSSSPMWPQGQSQTGPWRL